MKHLVLLSFLLLAGPPQVRGRVHYHPFSWTSQGRIRKDAIAAGDPMRGQYYDVSSLFETRFDVLEEAVTAPGEPCGKALDDYRLYLRSPRGREVWVGVGGCRVTSDYPGIGGTRLTAQGLNDLKRLLTASMPPPESFPPDHR